MDAAERTRRIVEQARALGFDLCGVAPAEKFPELESLPEWLARGYAGEMRYLHNPKRLSPELALPGARSVIVCAMNYNTAWPYSTEARALVGGVAGRVTRRQEAAGTAAGTDPVPALQERSAGDGPRGWISRYAWGDDYHEVLGARLEKLVEWMRAEFAEPHRSLWYVDTGPIVERVAAKWAGLGWLGKNTCLINEDWGSWLFLSVVITTLDLEPSLRLPEEKGKEKRENGAAFPVVQANGAVTVAAGAGPTSHESQDTSPRLERAGGTAPLSPPPDLCGQCTLCIDACPTGAIVEPYVLDARRCISYLTIELRGAIPEEFRDKLGWHIFGCDICQDVCPYNRNAPVTEKPEFQPREHLHARENQGQKSEGCSAKLALGRFASSFAPRMEELATFDAEQFEEWFTKSPVRRTKHSGLLRNVNLLLMQKSQS